MKVLADSLISRFEILQSIPSEFVYLFFMLLFGFILLFGIAAFSSGINVYLERRVAGRMQSRIGCNRVGPEGIFQFAVDGLKLVLKEDIIPSSANPYLFRLAPYLVFMGSFLMFAVIPFEKDVAFSNINIGLFYLLSVGSIAVVGVLMSGWSSNNKWALLGAVRSTAQIISYEIPVGLSLLVPVLLASTLNLTEIIESQRGGMWHWYANPLIHPFGFIAAIVFFIASLAELNRTPFDLPEAESELVSGYNTEYSGIRFSVFFVAEFANIFVAGALFSTAFLGGYTKSLIDIVFGTIAGFFIISIAFKSLSYGQKLFKNFATDPKNFFLHLNYSMPSEFPKILKYGTWAISFFATVTAFIFSEGYPFSFVIRIMFYVAKIYVIVFVIIWLRWTLPRFRIDQLMSLCWKKLVPIAFVCAVGTAFLMVI